MQIIMFIFVTASIIYYEEIKIGEEAKEQSSEELGCA